MTTSFLLTLIASTYGSGAYDTGVYGGTQTATSSGGSLTNTGIMIGLIVGLSALILLIAMIVRIWKRPSRKSVDKDETSDQ